VSNREYVRQMNLVLDSLYERAHQRKLSKQDWADLSGLSIDTIYRLDYRVKRILPRLKTVMCMADAVGYQIDVDVVKKLKLHAAM
jgi:hypothetical protein